ncbi:PREDICTED: histone deacetylase complex subunit SAP30 homolog [Bactrocera latifrons]|uniref:Histone deacetylase complex subunit SAP30 homolog n=3 Tax=Endopterygota TaxID=33392 RepID=A0A034VX07_BACDO|nr:histone deacetylase complex subunit SAP30 homolog [Bactrocera dorsalis]XP_018789028.1 PREDICTED: histone deacetylase complex subunit SAP30 homolog [Bactrocera latifrons]XP_039961986.1 histone deacetylase complex subunit SAP30 homolog [Bactrocera tryoni]XP_050330606.1 histone deacetylase complex subunit SAP30 homolog [Bactrocera neohumeralis]
MNNGGFSSADEDSRDGHSTCCLIDDDERCRNPAGNARYSKRIQKTVQQKRLKLRNDPTAERIYICEYHKSQIQSARSKRRRKESEEDSNETDNETPDVVMPDLYQLQVNTLRRYKRHYKVQTRPGMKRQQLADTIMKHFKTIPIKEKETITYFVYMVKSNSNKLDQKNGIGNDTT